MTVFSSVRAVVKLNDRLDQDILEEVEKLYKQLKKNEITRKVYDEKVYEYMRGKHSQLHSRINEAREAIKNYNENEIKVASETLIGNMTADETLEIDSLNNMSNVSDELAKMYAIKYDGNYLALKRLNEVVEEHDLAHHKVFSDEQLELIANEYPQAIISNDVATMNDILDGFADTKNTQDYTNMVASGANEDATKLMQLEREINGNVHEELLNGMEETYYWR